MMRQNNILMTILWKYKKTIGVSVVLITIMWLMASIALRLFSSYFLFHPEESKGFNYSNIKKEYSTIYLKNRYGDTVENLFIPNKNSNKILIYFHGNSGRASFTINDVSKYFNVFSPAYPGYHRSSGKPNNDNVYEVAELSINYLLKSGYKLQDIIVLGHSLGGSVAVYAGSKFNVSDVIVVNTFDSIYSMCYDKYSILCIFSGDLFNSITSASQLQTKFDQFHNEQDKVIPYVRGIALFNQVKSKNKHFYKIDGDHAHFNVDYVISTAIR